MYLEGIENSIVQKVTNICFNLRKKKMDNKTEQSYFFKNN